MHPSGLWKPVLGGLLLALAIYIGGFKFDQHLRTRRGPWQVTFTADQSGAPAIIVNQPKLAIANLKIVFTSETTTNAPGTVTFHNPANPFQNSKMKFEDLTYLPVTGTYDFFGHQNELIPPVL